MEGKSTVSETVRVPLTRGKFALIDDADASRVLQHRWRVRQAPHTSYAITDIRNQRGELHTVSMHRFILEPEAGLVVDHLDDNGLNNTRANMRLCSQAENAARVRRPTSRSGYRGVNRQVLASTWVARICYRGQQIDLGSYPTAEQAARAYDAKARELHGDHARLNFPDDQTKA
jgi:hypothetical protein